MSKKAEFAWKRSRMALSLTADQFYVQRPGCTLLIWWSSAWQFYRWKLRLDGDLVAAAGTGASRPSAKLACETAYKEWSARLVAPTEDEERRSIDMPIVFATKGSSAIRSAAMRDCEAACKARAAREPTPEPTGFPRRLRGPK